GSSVQDGWVRGYYSWMYPVGAGCRLDRLGMPGLKTQTLNGIDFAYYELGEGPLLLCLHGFPDSADTFLGIAPALAAAGYRVVMPYLRGYYPSGLSAQQDYSMMAIGRDVLA